MPHVLTIVLALVISAAAFGETDETLQQEVARLREQNARLVKELAAVRAELQRVKDLLAADAADRAPTPAPPARASPRAGRTPATDDPGGQLVPLVRVPLETRYDEDADRTVVTTQWTALPSQGVLNAKQSLRLGYVHPGKSPAQPIERILMTLHAERSSSDLAEADAVTFTVDGKALNCQVVARDVDRRSVKRARKRITYENETIVAAIPADTLAAIVQAKQVTVDAGRLQFDLSPELRTLFAALHARVQ